MALFSKESIFGRLLTDHRASPGTKAVPEGQVSELKTFTCSHCKRVVVMNPDRVRARGFCPKCDRFVCDNCELERTLSGGECRDFERFADNFLNAAAKGQPLPVFNPRPIIGDGNGK